MERNYQLNHQLLDQFWGKKCEVNYCSRVGSKVVGVRYKHEYFYYELGDDGIWLKDQMNNENNIYLQLDFEVTIENASGNIINLITNDYFVEIVVEEIYYPKCHHCGKEIHTSEDNWHINGIDGYGNRFDGDVWIIHNLNFCTDCIENLIGELPDDNPYCGIDFGGEC